MCSYYVALVAYSHNVVLAVYSYNVDLVQLTIIKLLLTSFLWFYYKNLKLRCVSQCLNMTDI